MAHGNFATAIDCMDGRAQLPVIEWLKNTYHVDYVDMITEAGADKALAQDYTRIEAIRSRAEVSVRAHGSKVIAIVGHDDCAGNPVSPEEHKRHILRAMEVARGWNWPVEVIGLWLDSSWQVHRIEG